MKSSYLLILTVLILNVYVSAENNDAQAPGKKEEKPQELHANQPKLPTCIDNSSIQGDVCKCVNGYYGVDGNSCKKCPEGKTSTQGDQNTGINVKESDACTTASLTLIASLYVLLFVLSF